MEGIPVSEEEGKMVLRIEEIISTHTLSNTEHLVQDIHGKASFPPWQLAKSPLMRVIRYLEGLLQGCKQTLCG